MKQRQHGFTLVELLIVIVVIGILASISIVTYIGVQNNANDTAIRSDLSNISRKIEMYRVTHDTYPTSFDTMENTDNGAYAISLSKSAYKTTDLEYNAFYCVNSDRSSYVFLATSKSDKRFWVGSASSIKEYNGASSWRVGVTAPCNTVASGMSVAGVSGLSNNATPLGWRPWTN